MKSSKVHYLYSIVKLVLRGMCLGLAWYWTYAICHNIGDSRRIVRDVLLLVMIAIPTFSSSLDFFHFIGQKYIKITTYLYLVSFIVINIASLFILIKVDGMYLFADTYPFVTHFLFFITYTLNLINFYWFLQKYNHSLSLYILIEYILLLIAVMVSYPLYFISFYLSSYIVLPFYLLINICIIRNK